MTDFEEARNYLNHVTGFAKKTSLSNVQWILDVLGNPEKDLFMIHVAGTNGKGSSLCISRNSYPTGAGIRTGWFSSPHLIRMEERIQIGGREISEKRFSEVFAKVKNAVFQAVKRGRSCLFFEFLFFMSLVFFREEHAEVCIIETGMGGRHDVTNVIMPRLSVITAVKSLIIRNF